MCWRIDEEAVRLHRREDNQAHFDSRVVVSSANRSKVRPPIDSSKTCRPGFKKCLKLSFSVSLPWGSR